MLVISCGIQTSESPLHQMNQASVMAQPQQGTLRMRKDSTGASLALVETLEAISRRAISGTLHPRRHLASPVVSFFAPP